MGNNIDKNLEEARFTKRGFGIAEFVGLILVVFFVLTSSVLIFFLGKFNTALGTLFGGAVVTLLVYRVIKTTVGGYRVAFEADGLRISLRRKNKYYIPYKNISRVRYGHKYARSRPFLVAPKDVVHSVLEIDAEVDGRRESIELIAMCVQVGDFEENIKYLERVNPSASIDIMTDFRFQE